MRFGVGYWSASATRLRPRHHSLIYDELAQDAARAEELGFDDYWVAEHHFWHDGHVSAPLVALAALVGSTSRIGIGTGVLVLPLHDPLRIAEMAASLDRMSDGRVYLALGLGYREEEYDGFGVSIRSRGRRIDDQLAVLDALWRGEEVEYQGELLPLRGPLRLRPRPTRPPVLLVGGQAPAAIRRAARRGAGLAFSPRLTADRIRELVALYHATARDYGVDTSHAIIGTGCDFYIAPTAQQARETALPRLTFYYGEIVGIGMGRFRDEAGLRIGADRGELLRSRVRSAINAAIVGDPGEVRRRLRELESAGINYVQLRLRYDSLPFEVVDEAMTLFATEVMPEFRPGTSLSDPTGKSTGSSEQNSAQS
jgi:alkanesulfonate monooxygenase SsuD/methylene tetrahydromethanopterin reductase-like flavin-dependent oxidoreductase (luciferase family)